jgi:hypothetical protein
VEARLLDQLAPERRLVVLALLGAAADGRPPRLAGRVLEPEQEQPILRVEHERADRQPRRRLEPDAQRAEPAEALLVRNRGVRR